MSYIRYYLCRLALIQINPSELQLHHLLNGKKYSLSQINQQDKTVEIASDLHLERNPYVCEAVHLSPFLPHSLISTQTSWLAWTVEISSLSYIWLQVDLEGQGWH